MQLKYRFYQRAAGVFYWQENGTSNRGSLRTKDRAEAQRVVSAMNEAHKQPHNRATLPLSEIRGECATTVLAYPQFALRRSHANCNLAPDGCLCFNA